MKRENIGKANSIDSRLTEIHFWLKLLKSKDVDICLMNGSDKIHFSKIYDNPVFENMVNKWPIEESSQKFIESIRAKMEWWQENLERELENL